MEVLLVRHGASVDGVRRRIQRADTRLDAEGRAQARAVGRELLRRRGRGGRVLSSDLPRAAETARIIARILGARVATDSALREIGIGPWEGRRIPDLPPRAAARWRRDARRVPRGFEPLGRFARRVLGAVRRIRGGRAVVVTHGGAISVLLSRTLGLSLRHVAQVPVENGSISRLLVENEKTYVASINETGHLPRRTGRERRGRRPRTPRRSPRRSPR